MDDMTFSCKPKGYNPHKRDYVRFVYCYDCGKLLQKGEGRRTVRRLRKVLVCRDINGCAERNAERGRPSF